MKMNLKVEDVRFAGDNEIRFKRKFNSFKCLYEKNIYFN